MAVALEPVVDTYEYQTFLASHRAQLETYDVPQHYWKSLLVKLQKEVYDAGEFFTMVEDGAGRYKSIVTNEDGVKYLDPNSIFLIDHAWTYEASHAQNHLKNVPGLAQRMAAIMGCLENSKEEDKIDKEDEENSEKEVTVSDAVIDKILDKMWCYSQTYQIRMMAFTNGQVLQMDVRDEEQIPVWYIVDEFGCSVKHSDEPTFNVKPFYYVPLQMSFNIMWPTRDIECGDEATRDFAAGVTDPLQRAARLLPWFPEGLDSIMKQRHSHIESSTKSHSMNEILPEADEISAQNFPPDHIFKVFTDSDQVKCSLDHPRFTLVEDEDEADIVWSVKHRKDFRSFAKKNKFINQFPNERMLTCKDLLSEVCRQEAKEDPEEEDPEAGELSQPWIATTFNLHNELPHFIRHYMKRKEKNLDNTWICKPWNLARSLDTDITSDLNRIIRLVETGPKIACKYLENPVLFEREDVGLVKFDFRYVVLLTSTKPLILHAQKAFWLRFANKPYSLSDFDEYEKHFTVMNYSETKLKQIHHYDFVPMFEKQYPDHKWEDEEKKALKVIRNVFSAACSREPPFGVAALPQSRAFYAIDMMLKWDENDPKEMKPVLLEVNYVPDCDRANKYYPKFFSHVFSQLFLGEDNGFPLADLSNL